MIKKIDENSIEIGEGQLVDKNSSTDKLSTKKGGTLNKNNDALIENSPDKKSSNEQIEDEENKEENKESSNKVSSLARLLSYSICVILLSLVGFGYYYFYVKDDVYDTDTQISTVDTDVSQSQSETPKQIDENATIQSGDIGNDESLEKETRDFLATFNATYFTRVDKTYLYIPPQTITSEDALKLLLKDKSFTSKICRQYYASGGTKLISNNQVMCDLFDHATGDSNESGEYNIYFRKTKLQ